MIYLKFYVINLERDENRPSFLGDSRVKLISFIETSKKHCSLVSVSASVAELRPWENESSRGFQTVTLCANISPCYGLVLLNGEVKHGVAGKASVQSTLYLLLAGLITSTQLTPFVTYSIVAL